MKHTCKFVRYDFTQKRVVDESITITFEFPKVTDDNLEEFENYKSELLMAIPGTGVRGHFSSWLQDQVKI